MASDETMSILHLDGDDEYDPTSDRDDDRPTRESSDADADAEEEDEEEDQASVGDRLRGLSIDIARRASRPLWIEDYSSETELRNPRRRAAAGGRAASLCRERCVERAWETRRCGSPEMGDLGCRVLVRPRGRPGRLCMDIQEVKACRDLGLELPCDWTVEISGGAAAHESSSGGSSPIGSWRISSPGDDPRDIKARLRVWAQAVALASSSGLSS